MYEFNHSRPGEGDRRRERMKRMFGHVGENVWVNQPITPAVGSTVSIGDGAWIGTACLRMACGAGLEREGRTANG